MLISTCGAVFLPPEMNKENKYWDVFYVLFKSCPFKNMQFNQHINEMSSQEVMWMLICRLHYCEEVFHWLILDPFSCDWLHFLDFDWSICLHLIG